MDEPRRNDAFDRELRRALAADGGGTPGPHVDAELAAAWMDRRLDTAAARSVEAHLAACHDCQALFATLARIAPDEAAANAGVAWWRRLRAGWLVPATVAAAAALVIWAAVPQQRAAAPAPESVQARDDRGLGAGGATPRDTAPVAPEAKTAAQPGAAAETDAAADRRFAQSAPEPQRKAAAFDRAAPPVAPATPAAPAAANELERRDRLADAAAPPPAGSLKETIVVTGESPVVDSQTARRAAVAGAAPAPTPAPERQEAASAAQGRLLRDNAQLAAGLRAPGALTIIAVDGAARWRRVGTRVEFAPRADGGFSAVALPAPAEAIAAGSSPGGTVCWLVGSDGLVLLTTDGVRFARLSAPASTSLVAVIAADARTATVTAVDGRRFRTTDGGATWTLQ